jgi:hypothetical protein
LSQRTHGASLQKEYAGNELKAVGNPMLHFFEQQVLAIDQLLQLALHGAAFGDVINL